MFFFALIVETSCGSGISNIASEKSVLPHKTEGVKPKQKQAIRETLNITFEDALGNRQKLKTGEVNRNDVGTELCNVVLDYDSFTEGNHFYFRTEMEDHMKTIIEVFQDKGQKLGKFELNSEYMVSKWGKYGDKLYLGLYELYNEQFFDKPNMYKFVVVDLNSWEKKIINCSELYGKDVRIFIYNDKIYIQDNSFPEKLDEIDMNGKKIRTILIGNDKGKKDTTILQGIMDGKIYYFTWNGNQHVLKKKDLATSEEKEVLRFEQPEYNKEKLNFRGSHFYMLGNNLFIVETYLNKEREQKCIFYRLPIKEGEKMECVLEKFIWDYDFFEDNIYYIDNKDLLHQKNLKKGTDKIISKRKLQKVQCTKVGLFVHENKAMEAYDEDAVDNDIIYFMDYNGKQEKRIAEIF